MLAGCGILVDRNPGSTSLHAKSHGRVDMVMVCCKAVLALTAALVEGGGVTSTALIVVFCIVALVQLYAVVCYQPLYNTRWNNINGGFAAVFAWAALATLMASQRDKPEDQVGSLG